MLVPARDALTALEHVSARAYGWYLSRASPSRYDGCTAAGAPAPERMDLGTGRAGQRWPLRHRRAVSDRPVVSLSRGGVSVSDTRLYVRCPPHSTAPHFIAHFAFCRRGRCVGCVGCICTPSGTPGQSSPDRPALVCREVTLCFWNTSRRCIASAHRNGNVSRGRPRTSPSRGA